jgi:hypothetical protein
VSLAFDEKVILREVTPIKGPRRSSLARAVPEVDHPQADHRAAA